MKYAGLIIAAVWCSNSALADTQLIMTDNVKAADDSSTHSVISVRDGKVAMQEADAKSLALYDSASGEFIHVDHGKQTYMVMDAATMDQAAGQMSEMMKQMEAQLASLPEEQRKAMMKMMPGLAGGQKKPPRARVEWTGKKDKVAGFRCKLATITEADGDQSTTCVAKPDELGMPEADFKAVSSMFETMQSFAERFSNEAPMPSVEELGGVPIMIHDANKDSTSQLIKVSTAELDPAMFEVPKGYRKQSMMDAGH